MPEPRIEVKPLSRKHAAFVDEYLLTFNATRAYMRVYPHCKERSARARGSILLTNVNIIQSIKERLAETHMQADEVLKLLADMARGDMGEFLDVSGMGFNLDLQDAKARGLTKLIKKVKQKTTTFLAHKESEEDREVHELEIELYDAQAALEKIGRHLDLFPNKLDVTSAGEKIGNTENAERYDRALSTLADALRESLSGKSAEPDGEMDTPEQTPVEGIT